MVLSPFPRRSPPSLDQSFAPQVEASRSVTKLALYIEKAPSAILRHTDVLLTLWSLCHGLLQLSELSIPLWPPHSDPQCPQTLPTQSEVCGALEFASLGTLADIQHLRLP